MTTLAPNYKRAVRTLTCNDCSYATEVIRLATSNQRGSGCGCECIGAMNAVLMAPTGCARGGYSLARFGRLNKRLGCSGFTRGWNPEKTRESHTFEVQCSTRIRRYHDNYYATEEHGQGLTYGHMKGHSLLYKEIPYHTGKPLIIICYICMYIYICIYTYTYTYTSNIYIYI